MSKKNIDLITTDNFVANIPYLPVVSELVQSFLIPSIALNAVEVEGGAATTVKTKEPGEKIIFNEIDLEFVMDENMDAYTEIFNWMLTMAGSHSIPIAEREVLYCDISLQILNNNKLPIRTFVFRDCFPVSIGAVSLDNSQSENVRSILTIAFTDFYIRPNDSYLSGISDYIPPTDTAKYS